MASVPGRPKRGRRFGGDAAHQKAMMGNLVASLIAGEGLVTTEAKAKALRPVFEKCVTKAKKGGVDHQRQVVAFIRDKDMAHKLFVDIAPRYAERPGGYTRILKLGPGTGTTRPWLASSSSSPSPSPAEVAEAGGRAPGTEDWALGAEGRAPELRQPAAPGPEALEPKAEGEDYRRLRLLVAYLGAPFHGFALQGELPTVARALGGAVERVLRHPVELTCAGRTDSGVHAWGQVVSLDVRADADLARVQRSVNKMLAPNVVVREATWAPAGFDARRCALSRQYRYYLLCSEWPDPFRAATTWHVGRALEVRRMEAACDALLGEHDFSSFCHPVRGRPGPLVRRVLRAGWSELGGSRLCFEIEASSFCHQMVRSIVGTLVEVGTGRRKAGELTAVLAARNRAAAGPPAPPHGLCLWKVKYPSDALGPTATDGD